MERERTDERIVYLRCLLTYDKPRGVQFDGGVASVPRFGGERLRWGL